MATYQLLILTGLLPYDCFPVVSQCNKRSDFCLWMYPLMGPKGNTILTFEGSMGLQCNFTCLTVMIGPEREDAVSQFVRQVQLTPFSKTSLFSFPIPRLSHWYSSSHKSHKLKAFQSMAHYALLCSTMLYYATFCFVTLYYK